MQEPRKPHLNAAKHVLKYVLSTLEMGLIFKKEVGFSLHCYADVDFGGDLDVRKSTSSYVFLSDSVCISWCSKKQD